MKRILCCLLVTTAFCCEDGWVSFNNFCYYRSNVNGPLTALQYWCSGYNASVVSITSEAEKDFIIDLTRTGVPQPLWLQPIVGAYRDSKYGPWKWYDGTPFNQNHFFFKGGPSDNELCAYLLADKFVPKAYRGTTNSKYFWSNGRSGGFLAGICANTARVTVCKKKDTTNSRTERMCGSTWTATGSSCYKKFTEPSIQIGQANSHCQLHGGNLASVTTEDEKTLVTRMMRMAAAQQIDWQTAVGCYRDSPRDAWKWYDGTPFNENHFFYTGQSDVDNCCMLFADVGVSIGKSFKPAEKDIYFHHLYKKFFKAKCSYPAYRFVCEKKACDLSVATLSGGRCVCIEGFIDIAETTLLEAGNYRKGEKCVPNECHVMEDTTILFLIDSSESITAKHWPKMLDFVESAATRLPTKIRVGFLKFSTDVSEGEFVNPGWSARKFKKAIPDDYDAGETNTPAALKEAKKMFKKVRSKNKIAVLITDGFPVAPLKYESEEEAHNATVRAAKELRRSGVRLTVMGVGPKICEGGEQVKEWVQNPKEDYFLLSHNVESLKGADMDKLVKMVCK